jgi:predicted Zn-dependent protease
MPIIISYRLRLWVRSWVRLLPLLAVLGLASAASAADRERDPEAIGNRTVSGRVNLYSVEREMALGRQLAIEVEKQARMVDDSTVSEYVNRIGQNLVRNSDVTMPVTFRVIESDEVNAFTLPGGYIFINTGMLRLTANEAQLASALAHELGHAAARHATRQASRNQLIGLSTLPLGMLGGLPWLMGGQAARGFLPIAALKFSREFETEADLLGVQYLWKSGYDPTASVDLLEAMASMEKRQAGRVARLLRSHPVTTDRIDRTEKNIDDLLPARDSYVVNTSEYESVRLRLSRPALELQSADSNRPTLRRK